MASTRSQVGPPERAAAPPPPHTDPANPGQHPGVWGSDSGGP